MKTNTENARNELINKWVEDFTDELYKWALYKTSSKEIAEDLVQDTFLSAFKAIENFKGDSQPKTWLFSILKNKIIDHYRKKQVLINTTDGFSEEKGLSITDDMFNEKGAWRNSPEHIVWSDDKHLLDNPEFNSIMEKCMDELPDNWRVAVESKYLQEKKAELICQDLNVTKSNYWQIIHRAKLLLKKCVELNWSI
jgi:RNA polymerase sigma-70 factor (TIGR02943 family)